MANIGSVYVEGLTVNEMNFLLNKSYKEYVNFPNVETRISNYRPLKVVVKGEVNDPGIQTLKGSMQLIGDPSSIMIKKDFVSAKVHFSNVLNYSSDDSIAQYNLLLIDGHSLRKTGNKEKLWDAIELFNKASLLMPGKGSPHFYMGLSLSLIHI